MSVKFTPNRSFEREMAKTLETKTALRTIAGNVAKRAEPTGQAVASSYKAEVEEDDGKIVVAASTDGINAGAWIELGTGAPAPTPAHAPLRKAVQSEGLKLK